MGTSYHLGGIVSGWRAASMYPIAPLLAVKRASRHSTTSWVVAPSVTSLVSAVGTPRMFRAQTEFAADSIWSPPELRNHVSRWISLVPEPAVRPHRVTASLFAL